MKVELEVISGPHEGRSYQFDSHDTFLVGRGPQAHFRLPKKDNFFSRLHFMVEVNPPFCRLTDLDSTNGTKVNRQKVEHADLCDGDIIRGGKTQIQVRIHHDDIRTTRRQTGTEPNVPHDATNGSWPHIPANSPTAKQIGPFELIRELGRGGMGIVHLGRRLDNGLQIALKTIRPDVAIAERDIRLFLREAEVLKALNHRRIVRFIEMGEEDGQLYFAMEYVAASNAGALVKKLGPLPVSTAVEIACQVLEALQYAHERRYVHRDIKPANVLVSESGTTLNVKLADFGLARVYQTSRMSGITIQGDIGGSLPFAPPEHLTNYRHAVPEGDLYSVGAMLYTLLTGKFIYDFPKSVAKAILTILESDPIPICDRRDDLPLNLAAIIHKALERQVTRRFASAGEMRAALMTVKG